MKRPFINVKVAENFVINEKFEEKKNDHVKPGGLFKCTAVYAKAA